MSTISFNADSTTLILNGTPILDFMAGDILELTPVNPATSHVNGSVGVNINERSDATVKDLVVRVQRSSDSDIFLNSAINGQGVTVLAGSIKSNFVKDDIPGVESHILEAGSITTQPTEVFNDTDGNGMMEYTIRFRFTQRNL